MLHIGYQPARALYVLDSTKLAKSVLEMSYTLE